MRDFVKIVGITILFSLIFVILTISFSARNNDIGFDPAAHSINTNLDKAGVGVGAQK